MGIISIPQPGSLGTQLGQGLAKGIAQEAPETLKRMALQQGLQSIKDSDAKTPLDIFSKLSGIYGMTPQLMTQLTPYIQQHIANQQFQQEQQARGQAQTPQGTVEQPGQDVAMQTPMQQLSAGQRTVEGPAAEQMPSQMAEAGAPTQVTEGGTQPARVQGGEADRALPPTTAEIDRYAAGLSPALYPTVQDRRARAEKVLGSQFQKQQAFEKRQDETSKFFDDDLQLKLQKEGMGVTQDVLGEGVAEFKNRALNDVASGRLSPRQAAAKYGNEALDFAKTRNNLKKLSTDRNFLNFVPERVRNTLGSVRDKYQKYGQLEAFKNNLISDFKISEPIAASYAYPVSKNSAIKGAIGKLGKVSEMFEQPKYSALTADTVAKYLKPSDSLVSIAQAMRNKGYDPNQFMQNMRRLSEAGQVPQLTDRQARELQYSFPTMYGLGDFFFSAMNGTKLGEK